MSLIFRSQHTLCTGGKCNRGCRGRDRMVVGFTTICASVPITTTCVNSNPAHGEVY